MPRSREGLIGVVSFMSLMNAMLRIALLITFRQAAENFFGKWVTTRALRTCWQRKKSIKAPPGSTLCAAHVRSEQRERRRRRVNINNTVLEYDASKYRLNAISLNKSLIVSRFAFLFSFVFSLRSAHRPDKSFIYQRRQWRRFSVARDYVGGEGKEKKFTAQAAIYRVKETKSTYTPTWHKRETRQKL